MKTVKKVSALVLTVMLLMSIMALPASAASASMTSKISCFPYLYHGVVNSYGVQALQKFLLTDTNNAYHTAIYGDGLDGGFGPNVENAVRNYQIRHGIYGPNNNGTGEVYTQTWTALANDLYESSNIMTRGGTYVYKVVKNGSTYSFKWNNSKEGLSWSSHYFAVG